MPFHFVESVSNAAHRSLGLLRIIRGLDPQYFIGRKNKSGLKLKPVLGKNGETKTCQLCGFALVTLELNENWLMQTCSATGFTGRSKRPEFAAWINRLDEDPAGQVNEKTKQYSDVSP